MDKYDFDKKLDNLVEILSELGGIHGDMNFLRSRLAGAMYDLENLRSDLEAFSDELDKENDDD